MPGMRPRARVLLRRSFGGNRQNPRASSYIAYISRLDNKHNRALSIRKRNNYGELAGCVIRSGMHRALATRNPNGHQGICSPSDQGGLPRQYLELIYLQNHRPRQRIARRRPYNQQESETNKVGFQLLFIQGQSLQP